MSKHTIVVSGLSRCGSSLMMQMLCAGGVPVSCTPGNERISGEHETNIEPLRLIALGLTEGKAIKVLDPLNFPLPPGKDYIFIWCHRDYTEQANSMVKFMTALGMKITKNDHRRIAASLPTDTLKSIKYLEKLGPVHVFNYEKMLTFEEQRYVAQALLPHFDVNVSSMQSVVIERSPKCYDGFLEDVLIQRAEK